MRGGARNVAEKRLTSVTVKTYATAKLNVAFSRAMRTTCPFSDLLCARSSTGSMSASSPATAASSPVPSAPLDAPRLPATALYAGSEISQRWTPTHTTRNTVESPKNANVDRSAAAPLSASICAAAPDPARTDASADSSCTPEIATATAAWPDMTACIAGGPKSAATATTAVCRYEPPAAWQTALRSTNAKNAPGGGRAYVLVVSRRESTESAARERSTRCLFDA